MLLEIRIYTPKHRFVRPVKQIFIRSIFIIFFILVKIELKVLFQTAIEFANENDFRTKDICEIARQLCLLPKVNSNKPRVVIITQVRIMRKLKKLPAKIL